MLTSSVVIPLAHGPLSTVQRSTTSPTVSPVMSVFGSFGSAITALPLTMDHVPSAGLVTGLPLRVVVEVGVQSS